MPRVLRIVFASLLLAGLAGLTGIIYLNEVVLPGKLKPWAESSLTQMIGRRVTIGEIRLHPWHGILLEKIDVQEDARYGKEPFLRIDRCSGGILYLPIFQERRIVIPVLRIIRPAAQLIQDENGIWNIQSLKLSLPRPKSPSAGRGFQVIILKIVLGNGRLEVSTRGPGPARKFYFEPIHAQLGLALPADAHCQLTTQLLTQPPTRMEFDGDLDLRNFTFQLRNHSVIPLAAAQAYCPPHMGSFFRQLAGTAACDVELSGTPEGPYAAKALIQTKDLKWEAAVPKSPAPVQGQGELRLDLKGEISPRHWANALRSVSGTLHVSPTIIAPLPYIGALKNLTGNITFDARGAKTDQLTALLPSGNSLRMEGSIANDEKKSVSFRAAATVPLSDLPLPPEGRILAQAVKLTGQAAIDIQGSGTLLPVASLKPVLTTTLQNVSCDLPNVGALRETSGLVHLQPDLLTVTDLKGKFKDLPFELDGTLLNFARPEIDGRLTWGKLSLETQLTVDGNRGEIHNLQGRYANTLFRVFGEISHWKKEPTGNLYGETTFDCQEAIQLLPHPPAWTTQFPIEGKVQTRWLLQGPLMEPAKLDWDLKANSSQILLKKLAFTDVALDAQKKAGEVTLSAVRAIFSGGSIFLQGNLLLNQQGLPWKGALSVEHMELSQLAQKFDWKTRELSGSAFLKADGQGQGADLNQIEGTGTLRVEGARILELPFLGKFADLLKLPNLKTLAFESANGPFTIRQGKLLTQTFQMTSPRAILNISGYGGFAQGLDSPIDWKIIPTLSSELVPAESRSKIGRIIAQGTSYLVGEIRVTGTWKNPKQSFIPKPVTQILNEQLLNLEESLKGLF